MGRHNLHKYPKFFDLSYEDCVIPLYLRRQLDKVLAKNDLPTMIFMGRQLEVKSTIAHALAKKLGLELEVLHFNEEPKGKKSNRGIQTLAALKLLLTNASNEGTRKLYIIEDLDYLPEPRVAELANLIKEEQDHKFIIFGYPNHPLIAHLPFAPQISLKLPIDHNPQEKAAYIEHCKNLLSKYGIVRSDDEFQEALKQDIFWLHILEREFTKSRARDLKFVVINNPKVRG